MSLRRRLAAWWFDDRLRWVFVVIVAVAVAVLIAADAWGEPGAVESLSLGGGTR